MAAHCRDMLTANEDAGNYRQSVNVSQRAGGLNNQCDADVMQYLSVLCGMVGSMDTIAPEESSRDRLVFLHEDENLQEVVQTSW